MANYGKYVKGIASKDGAENIFWIVVILFCLSIGLKIYRRVLVLIGDKESEEVEEEQKEQQNTVNNLTKDVKYTSLPKTQAYYRSIADAQYKAMQGWGTDWATLVNTLKSLSAPELKAVYKEFGARVNQDFYNESFDLFGWYKDEYSSFSTLCLLYYPALTKIWQKTNLPWINMTK